MIWFLGIESVIPVVFNSVRNLSHEPVLYINWYDSTCFYLSFYFTLMSM